MKVYRLCKSGYARDLSGRGAEKTGGRWNSKGVPLVYTSESRALCTTEIAVHTGLGNIPKDYYLVTIVLPANTKMFEPDTKKLPAGWRSFPFLLLTQEMGDAWAHENKFLVMKVPSAVVPGDFNYLLNPQHKDMPKVNIEKTEPFEFDERLFVKK